MFLDRWFRLSAHLTLGLSCVALVFADAPFLPGLPVCLAPVLTLLVLAWWAEGRWTVPDWGAHVLALVIAAGAVLWLKTQLGESDSWTAQLPVRLALLPFMGPLMIAALLVKLFQRRRPGDFWWLQLIGLMQVGLGCVLADGPEFGILLIAYLVSALACLALHYRRSALSHRLFASAHVSDPAAQGRWPITLWWLIAFTLRWSLGVGLLALLLFLLTPRRDGASWQPLTNYGAVPSPARQGGKDGLGDEIDLNHTGTVELDNEAALRVVATDANGQPKVDLPTDQRWRSTLLDLYEKGRWRSVRQMPGPSNLRQLDLPDFGPGQYFLTFEVKPRQAGGLVLAEPIRLGPPSARLPVLRLPGSRRFAFAESVATVVPPLVSPKYEYHYRQVVPAWTEPIRTPAEGLRSVYLERLTRQSLPGLTEWTIDLLRRLSSRSRYPLPAEARAALSGPKQSFLIEPEQWEAVARTLTDYLANSGEFTYTLVLTRQDDTLDPVLDFLVNVRQGHCERYASALALMLRSVGIPARLVKGYRGADPEGEGTYVVRHRHAHAWVETLVPSRDPARSTFDWLTLDPTPAASAPASAEFSLAHWLQEGQRNAVELWQDLIVGYSADEQASLWQSLKSGRPLPALLRLGLLLLAVPAVLLAFVLLRRLARRRRAAGSRSSGGVGFYTQLLSLLAKHAVLRPHAGQTPREFGEAARHALQRRPGAADLADVPGRVAALFYRVRFGDQPLSEAENQALGSDLDRLGAALRKTAHR